MTVQDPRKKAKQNVEYLVSHGYSLEKIADECSTSGVSVLRWKQGSVIPHRLVAKTLDQMVVKLKNK